jgi:hypothetical protein
MLKAIYIIKYLRKNKLLLPFCKALNVNFEYIRGIGSGHYNPSASIQKSLSPVIFPNYWYQETNDFFCNKIKHELSTLFCVYKPIYDVSDEE